MDAETAGWDCEAYGPGSREAGALCFFAATGERTCGSPEECARLMDAERRRVFARIQEMAAAGDETGRYLASVFTDPSQLLGGANQGGEDG